MTRFIPVLAFYEQQQDHEKFEALTKAPEAGGGVKSDDVDSVKKMNGDVKATGGERRPSQLITMPSCISLHSEAYDLTYDKEDEKDNKN